MPANTPGLGGVRKDDLSVLSPYACQCLADMMNAIDGGCPWPKQCTVGRLAFLSKGGDPLDPLEYRKLSMLSKVYRLHMSIRLKDLAPWVDTWALPELFAGTCAPNGTEDAWFETALIMELAKLQDNPLTGGGTDIYKRFDHVPFEMLLDLLWAGGCPPRSYEHTKASTLPLFITTVLQAHLANRTAIFAVFHRVAF